MSDSSDLSPIDDTLRDDLWTPAFHVDVLDDLVYEADVAGAVPLASYPDNRYPFAYPRDVACITRAWLAAARAGVEADRVTTHVLDAARFLLAVQDDAGGWQQRYGLDGTDQGIYVQEDNVAHGVRVLAHAVAALDATDRLDDVDGSLLVEVVESIDDAVGHTRENLYDPNAHLIESTSSIHEGRIESGYTLWVNCTFLAALRQADDALTTLADRDATSDADVDGTLTTLRELASVLERGIERAFTTLQQVPRRYSPDGDVDHRPDVTLFAPYYYGLEDVFGEDAAAAAERAAAALDDPELGGLQRFLGFYRDYEVQQHGGNGPWMQYTAWHAQYHYDRGDTEAGDDVLETVVEYADADGHIPEHLTTRERFESFMDREWHTRRDFEKEFDDAVLRDVPFDRVVEEAQSMRESYREMERRTADQDVIGFARPLAWCHAEFLAALLRRGA